MMLFRTALTSFTLVASVLATPLKRAEGINVAVTPSAPSVASLDDLSLTASITNTGAEAVKIINYGTILDSKLPTKSFIVTKDGEAVKFTGIKVSVSLEDLTETDFTVINPGQTVTVSHDVSALYDFQSAGVGKYSFEPITTFVFADGTASTDQTFAKATADSTSAIVEITGGIQKREIKSNEKRAVVSCSNSSRSSFISASYTEAKDLARTASSYVTSRGTSDSLYRSYWGANAASRITGVLNGVANESGSRTLSCTDPYGVCTGGVIAYTVIATTNIYYCSIFFNEVPSTSLCSGTTVAARNVRGGTTLHEITHAVSGTDDVTYGCAADQALSDSNKYRNADNYNCFATQVYKNTRC